MSSGLTNSTWLSAKAMFVPGLFSRWRSMTTSSGPPVMLPKRKATGGRRSYQYQTLQQTPYSLTTEIYYPSFVYKKSRLFRKKKGLP